MAMHWFIANDPPTAKKLLRDEPLEEPETEEDREMALLSDPYFAPPPPPTPQDVFEQLGMRGGYDG